MIDNKYQFRNKGAGGMMLNYYNLEKMYEFEQKKKDRLAREFWKWAQRRPAKKATTKEVNGE
jgi:hypothetical protein